MANKEDDDMEEMDNLASNELDGDGSNGLENVIQVSGMYNEWFLDYASYVILERAIPHVGDGLKPVQRRILHSLKEMDDGRYHKVANVIGNTMKYHPHGDASIGDAMVQIGQKDLLLDTQGNWGNILTGDRAAAARYIEVRLSKFALDVAFNRKTTNWTPSYDGRGLEPIALPMKFPLLLAQGVEGIAVGLACRILPHNFNELIDASIDILRGKKTNILPDFLTGGMADFSNYNDGLRGGRIRLRARIGQLDKRTLVITEIPYGTNTSSLIDSIIKANDRGKIKIRKIEDNTAENVEIIINLPSNVSPDKTIDALYAFTDCEVSISPNSAIVKDDKPAFLGVNEILRLSTEHTKSLLKMELEIRMGELQEQWHFSSLEKIFIENRIYIDIEECETWEAIIETIHKGLKPHVKHLFREVTDEDVERLTEIKIKRISKFDSFKADELIKRIENEIEEIKGNLATLTEYTIAYFKNIKAKYGEGRERKTEIRSFETIDASKVAVANSKLFVNKKEGFIGHGLKRSEGDYVKDCSDIDDIIVFREDGVMIVQKIQSKSFVGKNIIHVDVWKRGDKRTIYNMIYHDGATGRAMIKRFSVTSITRDREYNLISEAKGSKVLYFSANPNGEAEIVGVQLRPKPKLKKLKFDVDFADIAIKGRSAKGNIMSRNIVHRITLKEEGTSTLSARKIWFDDTVQRLNAEGRGELLGRFNPEDKILTVTQSGSYKLVEPNLSTHFEPDIILIEKWNPKMPLTAIYYNGEKEDFYVKRFLVEDTDNKVEFISDSKGSYLELLSTDYNTVIEIDFVKPRGKDAKPKEYLNLKDFISVRGVKTLGNMLSYEKVKAIERIEDLEVAAKVIDSTVEELSKDPFAESEKEEVKPEEEQQVDTIVSKEEAKDDSSEEVANKETKDEENNDKPSSSAGQIDLFS